VERESVDPPKSLSSPAAAEAARRVAQFFGQNAKACQQVTLDFPMLPP
jgi:hypothetical protein